MQKWLMMMLLINTEGRCTPSTKTTSTLLRQSANQTMVIQILCLHRNLCTLAKPSPSTLLTNSSITSSNIAFKNLISSLVPELTKIMIEKLIQVHTISTPPNSQEMNIDPMKIHTTEVMMLTVILNKDLWLPPIMEWDQVWCWREITLLCRDHQRKLIKSS